MQTRFRSVTEYTVAKHTREVSFPNNIVACAYCDYCKHKTGLHGEPLQRYENYICVLTYESLERNKIGVQIGKLCPLEFEEKRGIKNG